MVGLDSSCTCPLPILTDDELNVSFRIDKLGMVVRNLKTEFGASSQL